MSLRDEIICAWAAAESDDARRELLREIREALDSLWRTNPTGQHPPELAEKLGRMRPLLLKMRETLDEELLHAGNACKFKADCPSSMTLELGSKVAEWLRGVVAAEQQQDIDGPRARRESLTSSATLTVPADRERDLRLLLACSEVVLRSLSTEPLSLPKLHFATRRWTRGLVWDACGLLEHEGLVRVTPADGYEPADAALTENGARILAARARAAS